MHIRYLVRVALPYILNPRLRVYFAYLALGLEGHTLYNLDIYFPRYASNLKGKNVSCSFEEENRRDTWHDDGRKPMALNHMSDLGDLTMRHIITNSNQFFKIVILIYLNSDSR